MNEQTVRNMTTRESRTAAGRDLIQSLCDNEEVYVWGYDYEINAEAIASAVCAIEDEAAPPPAEAVEALSELLTQASYVMQNSPRWLALRDAVAKARKALAALTPPAEEKP